jgi:hypothetical protein
MASSDGNLLPLFARWAKQFGPIAEFSILGEKQVVLSTDKIAQDLFVKRGNIYSGRGIPHAMRYVTRDISPALMPKNGKTVHALPKLQGRLMVMMLMLMLMQIQTPGDERGN